MMTESKDGQSGTINDSNTESAWVPRLNETKVYLLQEMEELCKHGKGLEGSVGKIFKSLGW